MNALVPVLWWYLINQWHKTMLVKQHISLNYRDMMQFNQNSFLASTLLFYPSIRFVRPHWTSRISSELVWYSKMQPIWLCYLFSVWLLLGNNTAIIPHATTDRAQPDTLECPLIDLDQMRQRRFYTTCIRARGIRPRSLGMDIWASA